MLTRIFYGLVLLVVVWCAEAATLPPGFNMAVAPLASQSSKDLHASLVNAFSQVLVKMSGNSRITILPGIQQQLPYAEKFVEKYTYLGSNLQVIFDKRALITLLTEAQQPIWLSRPSTLVWISVSGQAPLTLESHIGDPVVSALQKKAEARAITITFPVMDSSDQADWQAKMNGTAFNQAILEKIAARYQSPAILYGELAQTNSRSWVMDWVLVWHGQTWMWSNEGADLGMLQTGIDKLADLMASQLAVSLDQQAANSIWLAVLGIDNLADYNSMLNALKQASPILGITVKDVGSHGVLLQITAVGEDAGALKTALAANQHFTPLVSAVAADNTPVLHYQWRR